MLILMILLQHCFYFNLIKLWQIYSPKKIHILAENEKYVKFTLKNYFLEFF